MDIFVSLGLHRVNPSQILLERDQLSIVCKVSQVKVETLVADDGAKLVESQGLTEEVLGFSCHKSDHGVVYPSFVELFDVHVLSEPVCGDGFSDQRIHFLQVAGENILGEEHKLLVSSRFVWESAWHDHNREVVRKI